MKLHYFVSTAVFYVVVAFWAWDIGWLLSLGDATFIDRIFLSGFFVGSLVYGKILMEMREDG